LEQERVREGIEIINLALEVAQATEKAEEGERVKTERVKTDRGRS